MTAAAHPCLCGHAVAAHHATSTQCGWCLCEEYRPDEHVYPVGECVTS